MESVAVISRSGGGGGGGGDVCIGRRSLVRLFICPIAESAEMVIFEFLSNHLTNGCIDGRLRRRRRRRFLIQLMRNQINGTATTATIRMEPANV